MAEGLCGISLEPVFEVSSTKHLRGHEYKVTKHRVNLDAQRHFFTE